MAQTWTADMEVQTDARRAEARAKTKASRAVAIGWRRCTRGCAEMAACEGYVEVKIGSRLSDGR